MWKWWFSVVEEMLHWLGTPFSERGGWAGFKLLPASPIILLCSCQPSLWPTDNRKETEKRENLCRLGNVEDFMIDHSHVHIHHACDVVVHQSRFYVVQTMSLIVDEHVPVGYWSNDSSHFHPSNMDCWWPLIIIRSLQFWYTTHPFWFSELDGLAWCARMPYLDSWVACILFSHCSARAQCLSLREGRVGFVDDLIH